MNRKGHKVEEVISTRGTIVIGCVCGWVHSEDKNVDAQIARQKCRAAYRAHKAVTA